MRRVVITMVLLLVGASLALAQPDSLVILHTNDTHAHLMPYGPKDASGNWQWGGFARVAAVIGMTKMESPNTLVLDAGDFSVGDFMFQKYLSIPQLSLMKAVGYDVVALGNHEFDLYTSTLMYMLDAAGFPDPDLPLLCANLDISGEPTLGYFVQPYTIKQYGNTKVGIVSLLTESANQISNPSPVVVLPALDEAQRWIDTLNAHDCDIVILLTHIGFEFDCLLAQMTSGADIIVGGHSHTLLTEAVEINGVKIVTAGEFGAHVGRTSIVVESGDILEFSYASITIDQSVPEVPEVAAQVQALVAGIEADPRFGPVYTEDLAEAAVEITKPRGSGFFQDTPMGNLIADAFRQTTGTDIAFQPQGFCGQTIYQGAVRGMDIFQAVPYGFDEVTGLGLKLVTFETDGMSLMAGLEFAVYNLPYSEDFILHGSNIAYAYNSSGAPGARVDYSSIRINEQPIDPAGSYTVTTSDAVVGFVSQIPGFNIANITMTDIPVYTVVKDHFVANSPVTAYSTGRLIDLAQMSDPIAGARLLHDVLNQYAAIGLISQGQNVTNWKADIWVVEKLLAHGNSSAANALLESFKTWVSRNVSRHVDPFAADRLVYLTSQLQEAIMPSTAVAKAEPPVVSSQIALEQNFPNPFNPTTDISFSLPTPAQVTLQVYNILGERVRTLADSQFGAGSHTVAWDSNDEAGNRVASGIYFYRLRAGETVKTKKMILLQ